MISEIFICYDKTPFKDLLEKSFADFENVNLLFKNTKEFMYCDKFDIIGLPTSFLEEFGSRPGNLDCMVLETKGKYNLPRYTVTSPNFIKSKDLTKGEMAKYQIIKPFEAALNFSNKKKENLKYAMHLDYAFSYLKQNAENITFQCELFKEYLQKVTEV